LFPPIRQELSASKNGKEIGDEVKHAFNLGAKFEDVKRELPVFLLAFSSHENGLADYVSFYYDTDIKFSYRYGCEKMT
jgi:hypothetical protein